MTQDLTRSGLAFKMLCAWNGITPAQAPAEWKVFMNESNMQAWGRVALVAMEHAAELCQVNASASRKLRPDNLNYQVGCTDCAEFIMAEVEPETLADGG